jgi:hypothetical protein
MAIEQIRERYAAVPFRPFSLQLADGRSVDVNHREFMAIGPRGRTVLVYRQDESFNVIDVMLVTNIEVSAAVEGGKKPGGNGSG